MNAVPWCSAPPDQGGCGMAIHLRLRPANLRAPGNGGTAQGAWGLGRQRWIDASVGQPLEPTQTQLKLERTSWRYTCKQIGSYADAQVFLVRQGHSHLDRDGDGEACEGLKG
jgi:hypothetical protein